MWKRTQPCCVASSGGPNPALNSSNVPGLSFRTVWAQSIASLLASRGSASLTGSGAIAQVRHVHGCAPWPRLPQTPRERGSPRPAPAPAVRDGRAAGGRALRSGTPRTRPGSGTCPRAPSRRSPAGRGVAACLRPGSPPPWRRSAAAGHRDLLETARPRRASSQPRVVGPDVGEREPKPTEIAVRGSVLRIGWRLDVGDEPLRAAGEPVRHQRRAHQVVRFVVLGVDARHRAVHSEPRRAITRDAHAPRAHHAPVFAHDVLVPARAAVEHLQPRPRVEAVDALNEVGPLIHVAPVHAGYRERAVGVHPKLVLDLLARLPGKRLAVAHDALLSIERLQAALEQPLLVRRRAALG